MPVPMTPELEILIQVHGALGARDPQALESALSALAPRLPGGGIDVLALEETLLQAVLFVGFPQALGAVGVWRRVSGHTPRDPEGEQRGPRDESVPPREGWEVRGTRVCRAVYGPQFEGLRANITALHPALDRWMLEDGYGRVLGRPGADLALRELAIVAILAVQDVPVQLHSHLRGALRQGVSFDTLERVLGLVEPWIATAGARDRVKETWRKLRAGRSSEAPEQAGSSVTIEGEG
jgi:4-carboxymuconolactone decarboxylase